ncbi:MAG: type II toxin-antitoxin system RelE/ParE family toxin [Actinomycetota bacterium]|nr:type II toxin-antitoxin system RelE/ParE family toxin [Actinomycetota bacterium]
MKVVAHERFVAWRRALEPDLRLQVDTLVAYLARHGRAGREPVLKAIVSSRHSEMHELRDSPERGQSGPHLRILFCFDTDDTTTPPSEQGVVLLGGDKTGNWSEFYSARVAEADLLYEQFIAARAARRKSTP